MHRGHGNIKAQRKRKKLYRDYSLYTPELYEMIDGNMTHYPYAYCTFKHGYLTKAMAACHRCEERGCKRLEKIGDERVG